MRKEHSSQFAENVLYPDKRRDPFGWKSIERIRSKIPKTTNGNSVSKYAIIKKSLRDNITYGMPYLPTESDIIDACKSFYMGRHTRNARQARHRF